MTAGNDRDTGTHRLHHHPARKHLTGIILYAHPCASQTQRRIRNLLIHRCANFITSPLLIAPGSDRCKGAGTIGINLVNHSNQLLFFLNRSNTSLLDFFCCFCSFLYSKWDNASFIETIRSVPPGRITTGVIRVVFIPSTPLTYHTYGTRAGDCARATRVRSLPCCHTMNNTTYDRSPGRPVRVRPAF